MAFNVIMNRFTIATILGAGLLLSMGYNHLPPIDCVVPDRMEHAQVSLESQCVINGEFHLLTSGSEFDVHTKHLHYQWVSFALIVQGICLCIPIFLWRMISSKDGREKQIAEKLSEIDIFNDSKDYARGARIMLIADLFVQTRSSIIGQAVLALMCKILQFFIVLMLIFITNYLLDGQYQTFLRNGIPFKNNELEKIEMDSVFPSRAVCPLSVNFIHLLCVLPNNPMHQKLYTVICWCLLLTALFVGIRILLEVCMMWGSGSSKLSLRSEMLKAKSPTSRPKVVEGVVAKCGFAEWDFLDMLAMHPKIHPSVFAEFLERLPRSDKV